MKKETDKHEMRVRLSLGFHLPPGNDKQTKPAYLSITGYFTLPSHSTELRVSRPNWDSYEANQNIWSNVQLEKSNDFYMKLNLREEKSTTR